MDQGHHANLAEARKDYYQRPFWDKEAASPLQYAVRVRAMKVRIRFATGHKLLACKEPAASTLINFCCRRPQCTKSQEDYCARSTCKVQGTRCMALAAVEGSDQGIDFFRVSPYDIMTQNNLSDYV